VHVTRKEYQMLELLSLRKGSGEMTDWKSNRQINGIRHARQ
jgi:hypothetical protein